MELTVKNKAYWIQFFYLEMSNMKVNGKDYVTSFNGVFAEGFESLAAIMSVFLFDRPLMIL